jgi:hypothetical protein
VSHMTLEVFRQKAEELRAAATPLGIHLDVFMTHLYRDGTMGTDYVGNHDNSDVWESVAKGALTMADGELPDEELHPEHPIEGQVN